MFNLIDPTDSLKLLLFSGKGGVGKTTVSCAIALHLAQTHPNQRVLLLSTDPAHSLGDVLDFPVNNTPRSLPDVPNLRVRSLDAPTLLKDFKAKYGSVLELLVERGSFIQGADLSPVWDLRWAGLDELMGILEIQRILRDNEADRIVVDMAPSGHTLNLFGLMDFLEGFLSSLELFQEKHRTLSRTFSGHYTPDAADHFLQEMNADLTAGRTLLQDPSRTACWIVAIPEPLSYLETYRFLTALQTLQIPPGGIFLNRLPPPLPASPSLTFPHPDLLQKFATLTPHLLTLPHQPQEPIGSTLLTTLPRQITPYLSTLFLSLPKDSPTHPVLEPVEKSTPHPSPASDSSPNSHLRSSAFICVPLPDFLTVGRRLVILGGKGGVGKTTIAASIAWAMATLHPDYKIRAISIDPAHSLGDAFSHPLSHAPTPLTPNLSAQEVNADQMLEQFREAYLWELADMLSGGTQDDTLQLAYGPKAWRQIAAQALPGVDEMLALLTVMDLLESGEQDLIVLDTAPTGHLLQFLEMPAALNDWLTWIFRLWMQYQDSAGHVELMSRLRSLRQRVVQAQKKLKDPEHTEFIAVFQGQSAIVAETQRLVAAIADLGIPQRYLVQNRVKETDLTEWEFAGKTVVTLPELSLPVEEALSDGSPFQQVKMAAEQLFQREQPAVSLDNYRLSVKIP